MGIVEIIVVMNWRVVEYLPTFGIFPVEIESVKSVLVDELDGGFDEALSGFRVVDEFAVLAALGIVPAAQGDQHFDASGAEFGNLNDG